MMKYLIAILLLWGCLLWGIPDFSSAQGWSDVTVRLLPDDSFALVEETSSGKLRYCPHHDSNGNLDIEHLIYVLGTLDRESWTNSDQKTIVKKHLDMHYTKYIANIKKKGVPESVNINKASLSELVALPHIGPVIAVKIVEFRKQQEFQTVEDIRKVDGIGDGIYNSIRHYLTIQ